jgi:hypothetical protein
VKPPSGSEAAKLVEWEIPAEAWASAAEQKKPLVKRMRLDGSDVLSSIPLTTRYYSNKSKTCQTEAKPAKRKQNLPNGSKTCQTKVKPAKRK